MCLIVHKPAGIAIDAELLRAALSLNRDGWGLMGFNTDGRLLMVRHAEVDDARVLKTVQGLKDAELVLHLRKRTRGSTSSENAHPFKVNDELYLVHNGTLNIQTRVTGLSDTWHLVSDLLRPLAQRHPGLFLDSAFHAMLEMGLRPENKVVLLHYPTRRVIVLNRNHGAELDGLWLSSTRWIDRRLLPLASAPQAQEQSFAPQHLKFL